MFTRILHASVLTKIIAIALLVVGLFLAGTFGVFLPEVERTLIHEKRVVLANLLDAAYNLVVEYQKRVDAGEFALDEAQRRASRTCVTATATISGSTTPPSPIPGWSCTPPRRPWKAR